MLSNLPKLLEHYQFTATEAQRCFPNKRLFQSSTKSLNLRPSILLFLPWRVCFAAKALVEVLDSSGSVLNGSHASGILPQLQTLLYGKRACEGLEANYNKRFYQTSDHSSAFTRVFRPIPSLCLTFMALAPQRCLPVIDA